MNFEHIALNIPEILLPRRGINLDAWAVIACDQYTSQPDYWDRVQQTVGNNPSSLHLIYPEIHLDSPQRDQMIATINQNMRTYLDQGLLQQQPPGVMLIDRKTALTQSRKGLLCALDLEHYDYREGATSLIRATEGTILDRLPPRIRVREKAAIELPHIMVLIDDPGRTVIEPLFQKPLTPAYDFDLMLDGGHITGQHISDTATIREIAASLARLADAELFNKKYEVSGKDVLLYAMGDGNHSFATAKAIWENLKKQTPPPERAGHPARYALVELVNVHDAGLTFEPIHRVLFNTNTQDLLLQLAAHCREQGAGVTCLSGTDREALDAQCAQQAPPSAHRLHYVTAESHGVVIVENPRHTIATATLQSFLDIYSTRADGMKIDYIHGADVVTDLGRRPGNIGFYLPAMSKHDLFKTIILDGALPRKTFSMGEADEKRFYLECRKIIS